MTKNQAMLLAGLGTVLSVCLVGGCQPKQPPSEDAILYYLRNARLLHFRTGRSDGKVRRLWPEGQEYVNAVLKADAELQNKLKPLRELDDVVSLWASEDPRWRDEKGIHEQLKTLIEHVKGHKSEREARLVKLGEVIEQTPVDLKLTVSRVRFVARVWEALAIDGVDLREGAIITRLEESAAARLRLCRAIEAHLGDFDPDRTGLRFKDASYQQEIDRHYNAVHELLLEHRDAFLRYAENLLVVIEPRLKTIDKRQEKYEYEYLTNRRAYLRDELEAVSKKLQALIEKAEEELKILEREADKIKPPESSKINAKISFRRQRIEQLKADKAKWKDRIDTIFQKAEEAAGSVGSTDE